jgi:hypothetical protein
VVVCNEKVQHPVPALNLSCLLAELAALVTITSQVIDKFFPATHLKVEAIAPMGFTATIAPYMYVWMTFKKKYPGEKIIINSVESRNRLMDLYLEMNMPYFEDPILSKPIPKDCQVKEPVHKEPGHKEPGHKEPDHKEPGHKEPGHKEPGHKEPDHKEYVHK